MKEFTLSLGTSNGFILQSISLLRPFASSLRRCLARPSTTPSSLSHLLFTDYPLFAQLGVDQMRKPFWPM